MEPKSKDPFFMDRKKKKKQRRKKVKEKEKEKEYADDIFSLDCFLYSE